ncbi:MAG: rubredoxin-like domain-containing protein [Gemmataceae bacterium]
MLTAIRVKFGLLTLVAVLLTAFAWGTARGQMRPPMPRRPGLRPPEAPGPIGPGVNPPGMPRMPGGGMTTTVWKCPNCDYEYQGTIPPSTCPGCQARMNNGVGNGVPGPGAEMNPNSPRNPRFNPPPSNVVPATEPADSSTNTTSTNASTTSSRKVLMIALGIGFLVIGVSVLLGSTCLVIYTLRNRKTSSERLPRRRRNDYDD